MNDVHYYLGDWVTRFRGRALTSGTNHCPVEGSYRFLEGEGTFTVMADN